MKSSSRASQNVAGGILTCLVFASISGAQEFSGHQDATVTQSLQTLTPPYEVLHNVDYNVGRLQELNDLPEGGRSVATIQDCALECINSAPCNMASWYGDSATVPNGNNCWLKKLELGCQYPADLEPHVDNRFLLLARPVPECEGKELIAPPVSPGSSIQPDGEQSMSTQEERDLILGNRQMDPSVPAVWMIESKSVMSSHMHPVILLLVPCLLVLMQFWGQG